MAQFRAAKFPVLMGGGRSLWEAEIDTLRGDAGADRFVLGRSEHALYTNRGTEDYAVIADFTVAEGDTIQLNGQYRYSLGAASEGTADGQGLFVKTDGAKELIAIIQVDSNLTMADSAFVYV